MIRWCKKTFISSNGTVSFTKGKKYNFYPDNTLIGIPYRCDNNENNCAHYLSSGSMNKYFSLHRVILFGH